MLVGRAPLAVRTLALAVAVNGVVVAGAAVVAVAVVVAVFLIVAIGVVLVAVIAVVIVVVVAVVVIVTLDEVWSKPNAERVNRRRSVPTRQTTQGQLHKSEDGARAMRRILYFIHSFLRSRVRASEVEQVHACRCAYPGCFSPSQTVGQLPARAGTV